MLLKCHEILVLVKDSVWQHTWDDSCTEPSLEWLQQCQLMRPMLNSHIPLHKQNCHSAEGSRHTSSYHSVLSAAVNHNDCLSVSELRSWNAHETVQRCHTTMNVSRISCNYECMFTLQASDSVGFSFTPDHLCSEQSLNNLVIFLHASFILSLSHCLFVSDHGVLSGPAWPLIIHTLIYDRVIATTGSCSNVKQACDLRCALPYKYWVESNEPSSLSVSELLCERNWKWTQSEWADKLE